MFVHVFMQILKIKKNLTHPHYKIKSTNHLSFLLFIYKNDGLA